MNCQETRRWISPYLDSELGKTKTFEVCEHLRDCPDCSQRFEAEKGADAMIRSRLEVGAMSAEVWGRISNDVNTPLWFRRLFSKQGLAAAACVTLVVLGAAWVMRPAPAAAMPSIVDSFLTTTSQSGAYVANADEAGDSNELMKSVLGVDADHLLASGNGHRIELVSFVERLDDEGRSFYELRLNCCGQPVLVALARRSAGGLPCLFDGVDLSPTAQQFDGVNVATKAKGDLVVVVASRHMLGGVVAAVMGI